MALPFIIASAIIHIVYFMLVGQLSRNADLSVAYPIMRGLAPLIAAIIALGHWAKCRRSPASESAALVAGAAFAFAYNSWADALTALAYLPIILCLRGRPEPACASVFEPAPAQRR